MRDEDLLSNALRERMTGSTSLGASNGLRGGGPSLLPWGVAMYSEREDLVYFLRDKQCTRRKAKGRESTCTKMSQLDQAGDVFPHGRNVWLTPKYTLSEDDCLRMYT